MGDRTVIWTKRAMRRFEEIATWYAENVETLACKHFIEDTTNAIKVLRHSPNIGHKDHTTSSTKQNRYYYTIHPLMRIEYRFTSKSITILGFRCTRMN